MSLLSDRDIRAALADGRIGLTPTAEVMLQPASIDVRLDSEFLEFPPRYEDIDPMLVEPMIPVSVPNLGFYRLEPGGFALASTVERLTLDASLACRFEGKSSLGRLGLTTHVTAGFIDPGFNGHVTLELVNHAPRPIRLWPGMAIGQLAFFDLTSPSQSPYGANRGSHYQGQQRGPTASRSYLQFDRLPVLAGRGPE